MPEEISAESIAADVQAQQGGEQQQSAADRGESQQAEAQAQTSEAGLPADVSEAFGGAKSWAEVLAYKQNIEQRYSASSRQGHELAQQVKQLAEWRKQMEEKQKAATPADFYGYANVAEWNDAFKKDPRGALGKLMQSYIQSNPDALKPVVDPMLTERLSPFEQARMEQHQAEQRDSAFKKYPDYAPGTEGHKAVAQTLQSNPGLLDAIEAAVKANPSLNATELAIRYAAFDLVQQQKQGVIAQQKASGQRAAVARPSTGGKTTPKKGDFADGMREIAAEQNAPLEWAEQLTSAINKSMR